MGGFFLLTAWTFVLFCFFKIFTYSFSMSPSNLMRFPVSDALKHPHSLILPPPCFTVGNLFFGWYASPLFLQTYAVSLWVKSSNFVSPKDKLQVVISILQSGLNMPLLQKWISSWSANSQSVPVHNFNDCLLCNYNSWIG